MPNFAYTNNTQFRPFSFEEQLKPLLMYTQAHQAVQDAYSELDSQANAIGSLANETNDPVASAKYRAYESALREQADTLAKQGLTPGSRQSLLDLKGRYANDITPIQNAIARRRELADEQRKALLQNPTLMFQRDMNSMSYESSLDRFLENPDYDYGQQYSGALLTQQVSQAASNLAKELSNYGNGKRLDNYTKTFLQQHGFTRKQVLDAINNPSRAQSQPVLSAIVEQVVGSSNMANWADKTTMNRAYNYARQGLWSSIGQTNVSSYEDYDAKLAAQEVSQRKLNGLEQHANINGLAINPLNIYSPRELSAQEKEYREKVKKYTEAGYFRKVGDDWELTEKGWEEYSRAIKGTTGKVATTPEGTTILTEAQGTESPTIFKQFLDSLGVTGISSSAYRINQARDAGRAWGNYIEKSPESRATRFDADKATEYDYFIDASQQGEMKNAIMTAARGTTLKEVDYSSKDKTFKDTGKELKIKDLNSDNYYVISTRFSPYGNTVMIKDSNGNIKRYRMPTGINTTNEQNRDRAMQGALQWQSIVTTGKYTDANGQIRQATAAEIRQAQNNYAALLQEAYLYHSQLGVQNKTAVQTYNPYAY